MVYCKCMRHNSRCFTLRPLIVFLLVLSTFSMAHGQSTPQNSKSFSAALIGGPLLTQGLAGVKEIVQLVGLRFSHHLLGSELEYQGAMGKSMGIDYRLFSLQLRNDLGSVLGVDFIKCHWLIGGDYHRYQRSPKYGIEQDFQNRMGWHSGFGLRFEITPALSLRNDYHLGLTPGKQLFLNLGFEYLF